MQKLRKWVIRVAVLMVVVAVVAFGRYGTLKPCGMLKNAVTWLQPEPGPWKLTFMRPGVRLTNRSAGWCLKTLWKLETDAPPTDKKSG